MFISMQNYCKIFIVVAFINLLECCVKITFCFYRNVLQKAWISLKNTTKFPYHTRLTSSEVTQRSNKEKRSITIRSLFRNISNTYQKDFLPFQQVAVREEAQLELERLGLHPPSECPLQGHLPLVQSECYCP